MKQKALDVDESMVPYYGKHGCKQFMKSKPIKFGFKMWSLNTPLGYCISFIPYQGKGTHIHPSLGLGGSVVYNLVSLLPKGPRYEIYFDNFFTSLLLSKITESGFGGTGTIRLNRIEDCPLKSVPAMKKTARGSYDYKLDSNNNIIVVRWNDNIIVTLASNITGVQPLQKAKRWDRVERKKIEITQPAMVHVCFDHSLNADLVLQRFVHALIL